MGQPGDAPLVSVKDVSSRRLNRTTLRRVAFGTVLTAFLVGLTLGVRWWFHPDSSHNVQARYAQADLLSTQGRWSEAVTLYQSLGAYKDSPERVLNARIGAAQVEARAMRWKNAWNYVQLVSDDHADVLKLKDQIRAERTLEVLDDFIGAAVRGEYQTAYSLMIEAERIGGRLPPSFPKAKAELETILGLLQQQDKEKAAALERELQREELRGPKPKTTREAKNDAYSRLSSVPVSAVTTSDPYKCDYGGLPAWCVDVSAEVKVLGGRTASTTGTARYIGGLYLGIR